MSALELLVKINIIQSDKEISDIKKDIKILQVIKERDTYLSKKNSAVRDHLTIAAKAISYSVLHSN